VDTDSHRSTDHFMEMNSGDYGAWTFGNGDPAIVSFAEQHKMIPSCFTCSAMFVYVFEQYSTPKINYFLVYQFFFKYHHLICA
jgi:hypothetical protein